MGLTKKSMNNTQEYIHTHLWYSLLFLGDYYHWLSSTQWKSCRWKILLTMQGAHLQSSAHAHTMFAELWNLLHVLQSSARATCGAKYYKWNWSQFYLELQTSFSCSKTASCFCKTKIVATKCILELWSSNCAFSGLWLNFSMPQYHARTTIQLEEPNLSGQHILKRCIWFVRSPHKHNKLMRYDFSPSWSLKIKSGHAVENKK